MIEFATLRAEYDLLLENFKKCQESLSDAQEKLKKRGNLPISETLLESENKSDISAEKWPEIFKEVKSSGVKKSRVFVRTVKPTVPYSHSSYSSQSRRVTALAAYMAHICASENAKDIASCLGITILFI